MSLSAKFDDDVCRHLNRRATSFKWTTQKRVGETTGERVDIAGQAEPRVGRRPLPKVFVEAELRREDPVSNVLKVWSEFMRQGFKDEIIFFQGFSRVYRSRKYSNRGIKARCAQEFGKMMEKHTDESIRYVPIRMRYLPVSGKHEGNGARHDAAVRFANRIIASLREMKVPLSPQNSR